MSSPLRTSFTIQHSHDTSYNLDSRLADGLGPPLIPVSPRSSAIIHRGGGLSEDENNQHVPLNATVQEPLGHNIPESKNRVHHFVGLGAAVEEAGEFNGGCFTVSHRDANTILSIELKPSCRIIARPGALLTSTLTCFFSWFGSCEGIISIFSRHLKSCGAIPEM